MYLLKYLYRLPSIDALFGIAREEGGLTAYKEKEVCPYV
jgi:hypothetical protein